MKQYRRMYEHIGRMVKGSVLDIGCGDAPLSDLVSDYHGFDIAPRTSLRSVWQGDAYDKSNYGDYDNYVLTEVLEHVDDFKVLKNIPQGKRVILSVPSFYDTGHLRVYTDNLLRERYQGVLDIKDIICFKCKFAEEKVLAFIYLADSVKL